jgi:hypothetical protein
MLGSSFLKAGHVVNKVLNRYNASGSTRVESGLPNRFEWYCMFPHRNVCSSQSYVSREQRRPCSGSAQARLTLGSGLLRSAQACSPPITRRGTAKNNLTRNHQLLTRGRKRPLFQPRISNVLPPQLCHKICGDYEDAFVPMF